MKALQYDLQLKKPDILGSRTAPQQQTIKVAAV